MLPSVKSPVGTFLELNAQRGMQRSEPLESVPVGIRGSDSELQDVCSEHRKSCRETISHISKICHRSRLHILRASARFAYPFPSLREHFGDAAIAMAVLDLPSATSAAKQTGTVSKVPAPSFVFAVFGRGLRSR